MQFFDYIKHNFDAKITEVFETYGGKTPCTTDCKSGYYDCLQGCPNPPDPTNCTGSCRDALYSCLNSCNNDSATNQKIINALKKIEDEAMEAYMKTLVK